MCVCARVRARARARACVRVRVRGCGYACTYVMHVCNHRHEAGWQREIHTRVHTSSFSQSSHLSLFLFDTGAPAARSGNICVGDQLLSVQDVVIKSLTPAQIRALIAGPDVSVPSPHIPDLTPQIRALTEPRMWSVSVPKTSAPHYTTLLSPRQSLSLSLSARALSHPPLPSPLPPHNMSRLRAQR